jgi:hypothetical protein
MKPPGRCCLLFDLGAQTPGAVCVRYVTRRRAATFTQRMNVSCRKAWDVSGQYIDHGIERLDFRLRLVSARESQRFL